MPGEKVMLDFSDNEGGFQNLVLTGPEGKLYTLSVRPILPDEAE